ncbi:alpha/beta hydrolase family protein [Marinicrinis sediminis]|uniref:Alpha/beta hydrolase family protein n=1 Tax=Marinicrinis sediminis TaxID=1652465 RepID=A0ABW5REF9_9BACL
MNGRGEERFVELEDGEHRMAGILHLPPGSDKKQGEDAAFPVILYCPGKNGERYEVHRLAVKFARYLASIGIAMLRFDYVGLGLSDGHTSQMTTSTKLSNVAAAYTWLTEQPEIDKHHICLLGFSDGARMALMSANRLGIDQIILWSPLFYEFGGNMPGGRKPRFSRHPEYTDRLVMPWAGLWISMDFYRDLHGLDIQQELHRYAGRSLVVYGDNDPLIEEEFAQLQTNQIAIYAGTDTHQVTAIAGGGHLFTSCELETKLIHRTTRWLQEQFGHTEGNPVQMDAVEGGIERCGDR